MYTSAGIPLSGVLDFNTMQPGDIVVIGSGSETAPATLTAAHAGVFITGAGTELSRIEGTLTLTGANDVTISRVDLAGGVIATTTTDLEIVASHIGGTGLLLDGTTDTRMVGNDIDSSAVGLTLSCNIDANIAHNSILGTTTGVLLEADETGSNIASNDIRSAGTGLHVAANLIGGVIVDNDVQGTALGVDYAGSAEFTSNQIHGNATGVRVAAGQFFGILGGANQIYANITGVNLLGRMQRQIVRDNVTGVTGSGVLGADSLNDANVIRDNVTGVDFTGTIQFNQISDNVTGIRGKGNSQIAHNVITSNDVVGILVNGVTDVQIANNTLYAETGDNIRLENSAKEVEVRNNILWTEQGTDIYVSDNSRSGFFSDYNQLHATGTGRLIHWMNDFADVLDWQVDVNRYDLHSIGTTTVHSLGAEPAFVSMARDDYQLWNLVGGLRKTNPSIDGADPRNDVGVPPSSTNLLTNPSFESGVTGWTTNVQGTAGAPNGSAFDGVAYFVPGTVAAGVAEQTIDLLAAGYSPAQLDAQSLVAVFGGRVRSKAESPVDTGTLTLQFRNAGGGIISQQTQNAANASSRWDLVGERQAIPVGTRQITYRFESIRVTGTTNDVYLDHAFVHVLSEAVAPDQGAYGHIDGELVSAGAHLALTYPDLYIDWQRDAAKTIRWESYDNNTNSPVRIDLLQDGVEGPQFVTTIAASTPDDGEFIWIPGNSGVNFDTPGLRIQVSYVGDPSIMDRGQESFTVPDNSTTYFVDDASDVNDEYTPGAIGSNRNTGKRADAPKPHPVNLLRAYDVPPGAVVSIDTGAYPMFDAIRLSGTTDLGLGTEEGFTLRGPTDPVKDVELTWIYPDGQPSALIELDDADFMTLSNLNVTGSQRGLWVTGGSDSFSASYITARNQSLDAIDITPNNAAANFVGLVAENAGRYGIVITGPFASLSDGRAVNNVERGVFLTGAGNAHIEAMEAYGNRYGFYVTNNVSGTRTVIGNENLSLGRGNLVHDNTTTGIFASASNSTAIVAGNTVYTHRASLFGTGIQGSNGVEIARNVVYDNWTGINTSGTSPVRENRVYGNVGTGINANNNPISSNVIYNNPVGIVATSSQALISNNLIYANTTTGIRIPGGGPDLVNNTIYQSAGTALRLEGSSANVVLRNNIVWATGGTAVSISNDSQTGFASDYNLLYATGTGIVGNWLVRIRRHCSSGRSPRAGTRTAWPMIRCLWTSMEPTMCSATWLAARTAVTTIFICKVRSAVCMAAHSRPCGTSPRGCRYSPSAA